MTPLEHELASNRLVKLGITQPDNRNRLTYEFISFYQSETTIGEVNLELMEYVRSRHNMVERGEIIDLLIEKIITKFAKTDEERPVMELLVQRVKELMIDLADRRDAWSLYERMGYRHKSQ